MYKTTDKSAPADRNTAVRCRQCGRILPHAHMNHFQLCAKCRMGRKAYMRRHLSNRQEAIEAAENGVSTTSFSLGAEGVLAWAEPEKIKTASSGGGIVYLPAPKPTVCEE